MSRKTLGVSDDLRNRNVARPEKVKTNQSTRDVDAMNRRLEGDQRINWCPLPVGDGLAMGRKR